MLNVEPEDLLEVLGEAETRAKKLAESDEYGFIAAADANAENVVHSLYDNIVDGRKVVVEFSKKTKKSPCFVVKLRYMMSARSTK